MQILRPKQVAATLGVALSTVYRWEQRDGFPKRIKLGPHTSGYRLDEIEAWMERQANENQEAA